ncbi:MAG: hypothetical protein P8K73_04535 [Methylophilaceae bacterium]|nr:hypothetical protein [Methylophilaceae bacterium]
MDLYKKLIIGLLSAGLILLVSYYFLINPYQTNKFMCNLIDGGPSTKLIVYRFLLGKAEVTFSNQMFDEGECSRKLSTIECIINAIDRDAEKITFNLSTYQLFHQWLSYDSGKFIYDKTQVAKTEQLDSYQCMLEEG